MCKGGDNEDERVARGWTAPGCGIVRSIKQECHTAMANIIIVTRSHGHDDMNKGGPAGRGSSSITKDEGRSHAAGD
jgi:hypothetical protein